MDVAPYKSFINSADTDTEIGVDREAAHSEINVVPSDVNVQRDGLKVTWTGSGQGVIYMQDPAGGSDLRSHLNADSALVFEPVVHQPPAARTVIGAQCVFPCFGELAATSMFQKLPVGSKTTIKIPIACFAAAGLDMENVNMPFFVLAEGAFSASFANVRWVPKAAKDADARSCASLT